MSKKFECSHPCPAEGCNSEVIVEYEVGRYKGDFYNMNDVEVCEIYGHVALQATVDKWNDKDYEEYCEGLAAQWEDVRETRGSDD